MSLVKALCKLVAPLLLSLVSVSVSANSTLQIAAAADLATCMPALSAAFTKLHPAAEVAVSIGSSGSFFAQIKNGAPFDVFLSADLDYPRKLAQADFADAASQVTYAHGQLVLWSSDPAIDVTTGFKIFNDPRIQRIAIANPAMAPYGRAARAALEHAQLWHAVTKRLVFGDNVAQTAQFISTGNAQVGIVGATHVSTANGTSFKGSVWKVPASWYPLIEQGGIVTKKGKANPLAADFLAFLVSKNGRQILQQYGLVPPAPAH